MATHLLVDSEPMLPCPLSTTKAFEEPKTKWTSKIMAWTKTAVPKTKTTWTRCRCTTKTLMPISNNKTLTWTSTPWLRVKIQFKILIPMARTLMSRLAFTWEKARSWGGSRLKETIESFWWILKAKYSIWMDSSLEQQTPMSLKNCKRRMVCNEKQNV